jgi:hypothetical protein
MSKSLAIALVGLAALAAVAPNDASAQGNLERRLAAAKRLECSFAVTPAELKANFFDINVDEGTAEVEGEFGGASFINVRYESGYLHIMQLGRAGPLYLTSVIARAAGEGKLMAVHTRIEYLPTAIPGFTSRPEQYLGTCTIAE